MTKLNTTSAKLPPAPKDPEKVQASFLSKLIDRVTRAIKQVNEAQVRTRAIVSLDGKHKDHGASVAVVGDSIDEASTALHEALATLSELSDAGYTPALKKAPRLALTTGAQVWLRGPVWVRKYQPMYKPEELDGLEIVAVSGKLARAKTTSGLQITEPVTSFTTVAHSYENAAEAA
jgi:hypothetical protein